MESDLQQHHNYHLKDHHQRQMSSGLTRYQSAPSSYISSFLDRDSLEEFLNRPTSPETERIFNRFLQSSGSNNNVDSFLDQSFASEKKPEIKLELENQIPVPMDDETDATKNQEQGGFASTSQNLHHPSQDQQQNNNNRLNRNPGSNLPRQSSSPAGFFSTVDIENAYAAVIGSMGDVTSGHNTKPSNEETSSFSTPGSKPPPPPPSRLTPISETDTKPIYPSGLPPRTSSGGLNRSSLDNFPSDSKLARGDRTLSGGSWNESFLLSDKKLALKTLNRGDRTLSAGLNLSETKNVDAMKRPPLAHHLSLPKSLSDMEKLLESSDSVAWKIRAKRGCATHPRSIAERVRRTRISERMKRLQDLVPNMDAQTNTADMLDLAVEYIKDLQTQVQILSENRARCTCSSVQPH